MFKELNGEVIQRLLPVSVISAANMTEVLYRAARRSGKAATEAAVMGELIAIGIQVEPNTPEDCIRSAELIAESRALGLDSSLSLGDALCLAMGERLSLKIVGGDQAWEALNLNVEFVPFR